MKKVSSEFHTPRVGDLYDSEHDFEVILEDARMNASTPWEEEFVKKAKESYEAHASLMFWSEKQDDILRKIAGPDDV